MTESLFQFRRSAAVLAAIAIAGYAGGAVASVRTHAEWNSAPEPYTMTYLGHTLHCLVVEDGSEAGNIGALSCDFVRYWRERR